ncbi:MAG: hypothetical protein ACLUFH_00520 [Monoglobales bacterium]
MKKMFNRITLCSFIAMMLFSFTSFAKEVPLTLTTIQYGDEVIEVPAVQDSVKSTRSLGEVSGLKIYIPATEEDLEYNREVTSKIKSRLYYTDEFLDPNRYVTFKSEINYVTDFYNGSTRIDISGFKITKDRKPDSSYLVGIGTPSATAYQKGYYGPAGYLETLQQEKYYSSVSYGSTQSVPSSWLPVLREDGEGMVKGVDYTITLIYMNSSGSTQTVKTYIEHHF